MATDGFIYRASTTPTLVVEVDAVLGFAGTRESRSTVHPIPTGGVSVVVRPHGPRTGTFQFALRGATAQARAEALEASLATGARHYLSGTVGGTSTWQWFVTGQVTFERVHDVRGAVWLVSAEWTAA
ncbi:hypothetical protein GCM10009846_10240 [Agrococcus versicolor]|uniref:Uncharacterized protein n=1 Tax=Agrococcus versicolor TaxID=501482 RepID=A0ABP5MHL5_9MICO